MNDPENERYCVGRIRIPIKPVENGWTHVGGEFPETITLQPSIFIGSQAPKYTGCYWHGFLTNGEMVSC